MSVKVSPEEISICISRLRQEDCPHQWGWASSSSSGPQQNRKAEEEQIYSQLEMRHPRLLPQDDGSPGSWALDHETYPSPHPAPGLRVSDLDWITLLALLFSSSHTADCGTSQPPEQHGLIPVINMLWYVSTYTLWVLFLWRTLTDRFIPRALFSWNCLSKAYHYL